MANLFIENAAHRIGTLRRFWKVSEIDAERDAEVRAAQADFRGKRTPRAVMIADVVELPPASAPTMEVAAHLVLGWDEARTSVTDFSWDYLPVLGYAVKCANAAGFMLHEIRGGLLYPMSQSRAIEMDLMDHTQHLVRRGQPLIVECRRVKPFISNYAEADCLLSDGRTVEILTYIQTEQLPPTAWYLNKRPADVAQHVS